MQGQTFVFKQSFAYYLGHRGNNSEFEFRASGAYIFRPQSSQATPLPPAEHVVLQEGPLYYQLEMTFTPFVSQLLRIPKSNVSLADLEIEWMVGPIPIDDDQGKEFIHRLSMESWNNTGSFYTDANGRQNVKRQRNVRIDYDLGNAATEEPVASNYYPINAWISMKNDQDDKMVTMVTDRSSGGSSITDDALEIMIHRRLLDDDAFGVQQALNETEFGQRGVVARGTHYIIFASNPDDNIIRTRMLAQSINSEAIVTLDTQQRDSMIVPPTNSSYTLPYNIHLLTLAIIPETRQLLIRLEHLFAPPDAKAAAVPATISLRKLLSKEGYGLGNVLEVLETTLAANQWAADSRRLKWDDHGTNVVSVPKGPDFDVTLKAFEIRTFIVRIL